MAIDDLDEFLDLDDAVPVIAGVATGLGYLDLNSETIINGEISVFNHVLTTKTDKFGDLLVGAAISVDGQNFKVDMPPQPFDDGAFCRIPLKKITSSQVRVQILDGDFL
jgi:hypothetical protein